MNIEEREHMKKDIIAKYQDIGTMIALIEKIAYRNACDETDEYATIGDLARLINYKIHTIQESIYEIMQETEEAQ